MDPALCPRNGVKPSGITAFRDDALNHSGKGRKMFGINWFHDAGLSGGLPDLIGQPASLLPLDLGQRVFEVIPEVGGHWPVTSLAIHLPLDPLTELAVTPVGLI